MKETIWKIYIMVVIGLLACTEVWCIPFRKLRTEEGLSHNNVRCLMQDRLGFVWIGTTNGLNCYDGNEVKVLRGDDKSSRLLTNTQIAAFLDADADSIWIGTDRGLYIYRRPTGEVVPFRQRTKYGVTVSCEVCKMLRRSDGTIWIGTLGQGIFRYDGKTLEQYISDTSFAVDMAFDATESRLFVATMDNEVRVFSPEGRCMSTITTEAPVWSLLYDRDTLWMGMERNRLGCVGADGRVRTQLLKGSMHFNSVRSLIVGQEGSLLLGTNYGLFHFNPQTGQCEEIGRPWEADGINNPQVTSLMKDSEGGIWIGTYGGGVNYMSGQAILFDTYTLPETKSRYAGIQKNIGPLYEDRHGTLYIGTGHGLYYLERGGKELKPLRVKGMPDIGNCNIHSLFVDGDVLWAGTWGDGLIRIDLPTLSAKVYVHQAGRANTLPGNYIQDIYKGGEGKLYVGVSDRFCWMDEKDDIFFPVTAIGAMVTVEDIYEDSRHNLWVGTVANGIYRFSYLKGGEWKHYHYTEGKEPSMLFSNNLTVIREDRQGKLWIGTNGNGLGCYDPQEDRFYRYNIGTQSFPVKAVYAIEEDSKGDLWIATNKGLVRLDTQHDNQFQLFTANDGLQGNLFNLRASAALRDGRLAFGGVNGLNIFNPRLISRNMHIPPVYVTGISFPYEEHEENVSYNGLQQLPERIVLPYTHNSFSLNFAALSFEDPLKNTYRYRMQGVDKEWTLASTAGSASYANLSPGTYTFEVKGANNGGVWNETPATLQIVIIPPWWLSIWAKIGYIILFLVLLGTVLRYWLHYVKRKYHRHIEEYNDRREKEMYQQKVGFFINLVHEIRTPLSLIRLPLERMMNDAGKTDEQAGMLTVIDKNVNYLLNIVNQLLDFQKMEEGEANFQVEKCNVSQLMSDIALQFEEPARLKGIAFHTILPEEKVYACIDRDKLSKIVVNLLGNALKYARTQFSLTLTYADEVLSCRIDDDGEGIPPSEHEKVFVAFYRLSEEASAPTGTGIGLAYARSLAKKQGGSLHAGTNEWGGAEFVLDIPAPAVSQKEVEEAAQPAEAQIVVDMQKVEDNETPANKRLTILVVEDNGELLKLMGGALAQWYRVKRASNGKVALDILKKETIDIIVSDVMMPVMDGLELCKRVKEDINTSHIPVILLTARTTLEAKSEGLRTGADVYIEKPFLISQLHAQIANLLRMRQVFYKHMSQLSGTPVVAEKTDGMGLSERDREFATQMMGIIDERLHDEDFTLDNLAEAIGMSRSNFYRKVRALYGMPPNDYLRLMRLNKAATLLKEGVRVNEVYTQVGFNSASYFTKCFKAQFGMLPREYLDRQSSASAKELNTEEQKD